MTPITATATITLREGGLHKNGMGVDTHEPALVSAWSLLGANGVGCVRTFFRVRVGTTRFEETSRLGVRARDYTIERLFADLLFYRDASRMGIGCTPELSHECRHWGLERQK